MKGTPGPSGLAGKCAAAAGAVRVGSGTAGVTRGACRYGSGQGPVQAVARVPSLVPGAPPRTASTRACGLPSWTLVRRRPAGPPRAGSWGEGRQLARGRWARPRAWRRHGP
jgi:hypothetical protein